MLTYPKIDPIILQIGPLAFRWYGLMYLLGFAASYLLINYQVKKRGLSAIINNIDSFFGSIILGLLLGGRLGYVFFYDLPAYLAKPWEILAVWHGGMSFHGGLIGAVVAGILFSSKNKMDFWALSDLVVVTAPIGIGLGRLGNFINGELYGRVTDVPWAMVFPSGGPLPRHPSQLYEFLLEGIALFIILWLMKDRRMKSGMLTAVFVLFYGLFRFGIEFFREPDKQLGFIWGPFTMGQMLSVLMILIGAIFLGYRRLGFRIR